MSKFIIIIVLSLSSLALTNGDEVDDGKADDIALNDMMKDIFVTHLKPKAGDEHNRPGLQGERTRATINGITSDVMAYVYKAQFIKGFDKLSSVAAHFGHNSEIVVNYQLDDVRMVTKRAEIKDRAPNFSNRRKLSFIGPLEVNVRSIQVEGKIEIGWYKKRIRFVYTSHHRVLFMDGFSANMTGMFNAIGDKYDGPNDLYKPVIRTDVGEVARHWWLDHLKEYQVKLIAKLNAAFPHRFMKDILPGEFE